MLLAHLHRVADLEDAPAEHAAARVGVDDLDVVVPKVDVRALGVDVRDDALEVEAVDGRLDDVAGRDGVRVRVVAVAEPLVVLLLGGDVSARVLDVSRLVSGNQGYESSISDSLTLEPSD